MALFARTVVLASLLVACGGPLPEATREARYEPDTPPALSVPPPAPDASLPPSDHPAVIEADATTRCESAPELSAPENESRERGAFVLRGLSSRSFETAQGCYWRGGHAILARFVAPRAGRWRMGVQGVAIRYLSVNDGCEGERLRCESNLVRAENPLDAPSLSTAITLRAGQALSLVVTCARDDMSCAADLFAQRVEDRGCFETDTPCEPGLACVWTYENNTARGRCTPGTAPRLRDVRVYSVGAMSASAVDPDGDHRRVFAELLDARGEITPLRGDRTLEGEVEGQGATTAVRWLLGRGYPMPDDAVRARVWLRDGAGLESERVEVPIEAPTELAEGQSCVLATSDPFTQITVCEAGTRCLTDGSVARCIRQRAPTLPRAAAWYDATERALSIDLDATDPDQDIRAAQIEFLDAQGVSLPGQSFAPYSSWRYLAERPDGQYRLDERAVPAGMVRVRVRVGDTFGLWSAWLEVVPTSSTTVAPGDRCDPTSTARVRCELGVAGCVPRVGEELGRCEAYERSCPRYWNASRWILSAAGTYSVSGAPLSWSTPTVSCLQPRSRVGTEYELVAPRAGTYRFVLEGPEGFGGYSLALRDACGGPDLSAEHACRAADESSRRAEITRELAAGERVMMVVTAGGSGVRYRLSVTVP